MSTADTRPTVSDVVREAGVSAAALRSVVPGLSIHMARHIVRGTSTGVTYARDVAAGLRTLASQHRKGGTGGGGHPFEDAAAKLEAAYPATPSPDAREKPPEDKGALVIYLAKRRKSFASIGERVGLTREGVRQRVVRYERRTGEKIPRCGTDY